MNGGLLLTFALAATISAAEPTLPGGFLSTISGEVIHANTIELPRVTLSDVVAFPVMTKQILRLNDVRGQAYGGVVTGTVTIDLADPQAQHVTAQLVLTDIDLGQLAAAITPTSSDIAGKLSGTVEIDIPFDHPEWMSGHGEATIREATLVELSVFTSILMGDLGKSRGQDSAAVQFSLGNGRWIIDNLLVQLSKAQVQMKGTVTFEGDMDMQVSPRFGSFLGLVPILGRLFDTATGALTSRVARGVLRGPASKPVWLYRPFGE